MSNYVLQENRGNLFKNDRKEQESHADYQGKLNVDGKEYYLNAWLNTSDKGTKWMSLSVKEIVNQSEQVKQDFDNYDPEEPPF